MPLPMNWPKRTDTSDYLSTCFLYTLRTWGRRWKYRQKSARGALRFKALGLPQTNHPPFTFHPCPFSACGILWLPGVECSEPMTSLIQGLHCEGIRPSPQCLDKSCRFCDGQKSHNVALIFFSRVKKGVKR
ncbi:hypothetical protein HJG60_010290 [Phyllostomus discolor]|uniref:Uncharacterized protein n=1 Tax=Phyllostomus discolor TaxID=89673 RepID=A0A834AZT4_9CHIR|nr:hypothetical protein HJG60_010290 [Phyllostomus discolor]